jgi:superfamily II DNA or RNA helicase
MKERVFILTPQIEIFEQWLIALAELGIDFGIINDGIVLGQNKFVYVCMPLTLANILSKIPARFFPHLIISDECHHSSCDTWQNIYTFYPNARRLGLTATPKRTDGKPLTPTYDEIIEVITFKDAIQRGFLSEYLLVVPEEYKMNIPIRNGDYDVNEQAQLLGESKIIGNAIEWYSKIFAGLPCLVACATFEHAKQMTDAFCEAGWSFEHIHSGLASAGRKRMLRELRAGKINGLCTVGIGIEGMDIPGLFGLIWLRRTLSVTIFLQFIGRALRKSIDKKYGIILDLVGNVFIHGLPDRERKWTLEGTNDKQGEAYDTPKMKICPQCKVLNSEQNAKCHICGYDFINGELTAGNARKIPAMVDGELVLLDESNLSERKEEIKAALDKQREYKAEKEKPPIELSRVEKMKLLKTGLERKNGLFADAVRNRL